MSDAVRCSEIIRQVNVHADEGGLFTDSIGQENGTKTRSFCFCLDRLWAWMNGVSYDKNEVAKSINTAFKGVDLTHLTVSKEELNLFQKNLIQLNSKFRRGSKFDQKFDTVISAVLTHVQLDRPTNQGSPVPRITPPKQRYRKDIWMEYQPHVLT